MIQYLPVIELILDFILDFKGVIATLITAFFTYKGVRVTSRVKTLEAHDKDKDKRIEALEEKNETYQITIIKLNKEIKSLTERVKHDTELVRGLDVRCKLQQQEIDALNEKIIQYEINLEKYKQEIEDKNIENARLKERIVALEDKIGMLKEITNNR